MKKFYSLLLVVIVLLSICSAAFADHIPLRQYPMPAQIVKTVLLTDTCGLKADNPGKLYVRHYLWSNIPNYYGSSNYTNYFQAVPEDDLELRYGGKWMAPGTANYVLSNSITSGESYGTAGRGNTKYADDGIPIIRVSGYMDADG